ncbi:hypothetical protein RA272_28685, partial [Pseudomonas syringae pv. tagetis]
MLGGGGVWLGGCGGWWLLRLVLVVMVFVGWGLWFGVGCVVGGGGRGGGGGCGGGGGGGGGG